jgi:catechol 2,3-dioxygenase-like lactoylglutathione lyase family enzyme
MPATERPRLDAINHLNIRVRDPAKSSRFYREVLGMKEAFSEMPRAIFLTSGKDLLTLARTKRRPRSGGMHFGFRARGKGEYEKWKSWLQSKNVRIMSEREEESGGGIYFKDPDGYTIEVYDEV